MKKDLVRPPRMLSSGIRIVAVPWAVRWISDKKITEMTGPWIPARQTAGMTEGETATMMEGKSRD
ncbi:MAG TPA: hypothetical protein ENK89_05980 [Desulfobulbaceae bacterium]|nr:hypothetical protein [Desulfobulbaceae bacterium]